MTGILPIIKTETQSALNNFDEFSIIRPVKTAKYYGFTKDEVKQLLSYYDAKDKYYEVCSWYDGYLFGNQEIFNPWSVINYVAEECIAKPFWQSTMNKLLLPGVAII